MNLKTTWSKWIFSVNPVKNRPHDAPLTSAQRGAIGNLVNFEDFTAQGVFFYKIVFAFIS